MAVSRSDAASLRAEADGGYRRPSDKMRGKVHLATALLQRKGDTCGRSQPFLHARLSFISIEHGFPGAIA